MEITEKSESRIELQEFIFLILERWVVIILIGVTFAAGTWVITHFFMTPQYTSTTSLYVISRQNNNQITNSDLNASTILASDFEILITSRTVLEQVIKDIALDTTAVNLAAKITVSNPTDTRILKVSVKDPDPKMAKQIADAVAVVASEQIVTLMGVEKVNIVDYGNIADKPTSPNLVRNVVVGTAAGVILTILIIFLIYISDDSVKTPEDVERYLDISVLGMIPLSNVEIDDSGERKKKGSALVQSKKTRV